MNIEKQIADYDRLIERGEREAFFAKTVNDIAEAAEKADPCGKRNYIIMALKVGFMSGYKAGNKKGRAAGTKTACEYFGFEYSEFLETMEQLKNASREDRRIIHAFTSEYLKPQTPSFINK